jgi:hypothetical protein
VDEFTLASRLSYFLWSSMPDERLFALAGKRRLGRNLESEVRRMLMDAKSRALVDNFAGQWLQIRNLELAAPDRELFPKFDDDLRQAMRRETELLFEHVKSADRSILDFLDADYSFMNDRLAQHYGLGVVLGPEFERVSLAGTPRRGVLSHGSILTLTSNPTRTSPVKRGKWVLEALLNAPPPPPPPDVPELKEGKELAGTLRQRMEQHRASPACASCHARMDPIGFSLENFDATGAWREKDGREMVDASGALVTGETFEGARELADLLARQKKDQFARVCGPNADLRSGTRNGVPRQMRAGRDRQAVRPRELPVFVDGHGDCEEHAVPEGTRQRRDQPAGKTMRTFFQHVAC